MQPDNQQLQPQPDQPQTYPEGEPAESMGANQQTAVGPQASGAPGSINPTETEALPDNIDPSLISAAKKREIEAANVVKRGLPKWIKPAAIAVGVLTLVGLGVWAFFVYYWNSNEQVMMRILSTVAQQSPAS
ncbi:hypothetical protein EOM57_04685, partial [Candidatus Saccharibacteria bacterium]|nr:hypothetical protein [Candidatus Saccharibacteria bacterium]